MARQITLQLLADSSKFESGMANAARAADTGAERIEDAAKKADRMSGALDRTGAAADASESKFIGLADVASGMGDLFGIEALGPIAATGMALGDLTGGFAQLAPVMTGAIDKIKNLSVVTKLQTAAQGVMNAVMNANPIFLVVAAIVALIAIFVVAYHKVDWFRDLVDGAFRAIKGAVEGVFNWVKDHWPLLLAILTGPIGLAILAITTHWDTIKNGFTAVKNWIRDRIDEVVGFFTGFPARLARAASGLWDFFYDGFKEAYNQVARFIRGLDFTIDVPDFLPGPDKYTIGFPDLPLLRAKGGPVWPGGSFMVGERGPELFVPQTAGTIVPHGAGGGTLVVNLGMLDSTGAGPAVMRAIEEYESRNGVRFARTAA